MFQPSKLFKLSIALLMLFLIVPWVWAQTPPEDGQAPLPTSEGGPVYIPNIQAQTSSDSGLAPLAISEGDRIYTSDQTSNTVTVIKPATNEVLGTISLGESRLDGVLGPVDTNQVNVHGLGFSRDGRFLDVVSVTSNGVQVIETATNQIVQTSYVGRAPHEGFISPDGQTIWVAVRGQDHVAIVSRQSGEIIKRIRTAPGTSKVVFSPDGRLAWVNHLFTNELVVIDVASRQIIKRIPISPEAGGSADLAIAPDNEEVWLGHPNNGKTTVVDAKKFQVKAVLDTGPRTNHPNFVTRDNQKFAYVTVGGLDQTMVFRRTEGAPQFVTAINHLGLHPHGIWPSPDNSRIYVVLQKTDTLEVIDTATNQVLQSLPIGQDPQTLVYIPNAVPQGDGRANLTQQGLGKRVENMHIELQGVAGDGHATIREVEGLDEIGISVRGLPPNQTFTIYASDGEKSMALLDVRSNAAGVVEGALAFTKFFANNYNRVIMVPQGQPAP
jgi:YVTN family beta-propeller protein